MILHPQTIEFLKWLEDFNDRKFFELYKPLYLQIKEKFDNLIEFLIKEISEFDDQIIWTEIKKCTFRIYKDMRFPRNRKHPYKTNLWANIANEWRKSQKAWYYIHIQDNQSFFSGWIYHPNAQKANEIRRKIYKDRDIFKKIIQNKKFKETFWEVFSHHQELKRIPKEFDPKHPSIKYIRYKDRLIHKKISNKKALSQNLSKDILKYTKIAKKLNDFLD